MHNVRLIARLDIKNNNLIKGINLEGLRVIGPAANYAKKYYFDGADELILMDSVASLYGRNHLDEVLAEIVKDVFIPITVGGGIRTLDDATKIIRSGADKLAVNTGAVANPELITLIAEKYGTQAMVLSVEAKKVQTNKWEVYIENGREKTALDVVEWVDRAVKLGAGEILLTSVDHEGMQNGFDLELMAAIKQVVNVPVVASGGMGNLQHFSNIVKTSGIEAVAVASMLHYEKTTIHEIREYAVNNGINVRHYES